MNGDGQNRRWYQFHVISLFALLVTGSAVVEVNLDSHHEGSLEVYPSPPLSHGWPRPFLVRSLGATSTAPYKLTFRFEELGANAFTPLKPPSRWPFDKTPVRQFSGIWLAVDIICGLAIVVFSVFAIERWARARSVTFQFSLRLLLTVLAWAATCSALITQLAIGWELILSRTAIVLLVVSIGLAWQGFIDFVMVIFHRMMTLFTPPPRTSTPSNRADGSSKSE